MLSMEGRHMDVCGCLDPARRRRTCRTLCVLCCCVIVVLCVCVSDLVRASELYSRACRDVARAAMAAISSLAAEAVSIVTVLLFSFCRKHGTSASSTISIWRLGGATHRTRPVTHRTRPVTQRTRRITQRTRPLSHTGHALITHRTRPVKHRTRPG